MNPAQKRALLAQRLKQAAQAGETLHAPLSLSQQRLWFIDQMQPGQSVYTITAALRLRGDLDEARLSDALNRIRARHGALRTRFVEDKGAPLQRIEPAVPLDLARLEATEATLAQVLDGFAAQGFDLAAGPLLRCALVRLADGDHVLGFAAHHIIADYRSLQVMIAELVAFYGGGAMPPVAQYADHALSQRKRAAELDGQLGYWRETLSGLAPLLDLPTDFPRPAHQRFDGARHRFTLPDEVTARVEALARARGVTPFTLLLAGFHLLHQRYSGSRDICIGTTVSNRDRAELQNVVGYFVNTLPLRAQLAADDSFYSFLDRLRGGVLGAMAHQEVPFEQIVDAAATERSLAHSPIFQSMFNLHEKQPSLTGLPGLQVEPLPLAGRNARFDLCLDLFRGDGISGVLEYATALFTPETAARMARDYVRILDAATADPAAKLSGIALLDHADRAALARFNDTAQPIATGGLAGLLARGDTVALIHGDTRLTHDQLNVAANRLAQVLSDKVTKGDRLAICLPRTPDLVVALLAALKLGASYVPLDPTHPAKRLQMILEDAQPALMLVSGPAPVDARCKVIDLTALPDAPATAPDRQINGEDIAYVIFTSGTTGRPKGVPIRHDSLINLLSSMAHRPGMTASDTLVAVTTPAFDIAGLELFLPLLTGGTLVLADAYDVIDGRALAGLITRHNATMMQATPATWRLLIEEGWTAPEGFRVLSGGEALDPGLARDLLAAGADLWNLYGPTETTVWSACAHVTDPGNIHLGQPVANTSLLVLDDAGQICPPGVAGELHIGGAGLSPGYFQRPDLTEGRFVTIRGQRLYKTGDRVRRLADGTLLYLGRLDFQIKLRGFRIELGDIEAHLAADPDVEQAVVTLHGQGDDAALIAYLRSSAAPGSLEPRLRDRLSAELPGYMIPAIFVVLDAFPLNSNGKVDRLRLPAPTARQGIVAAPRSATEAILSRLWQDILTIPAPDRNADFFALGGHSLLAMRMIARLPHQGPRAVPLRLLFEHPRLSDFAAALDQAGLMRAGVTAPIPRLPEGVDRPLSHAQARQWALDTLDPGQSAYNLSAAIRLTGDLDPARLGRAWALTAARHEILRSAYPAIEGRPRVVVHPAPAPDLPVTDLAQDGLIDALRAEAGRPFDLATGPLARLALYRVGGDHALLLVMHHIIGDALSLQLVLRELLAAYDALTGDAAWTPAPLPVQYTDYAAWQRGQDIARHSAYWIEELRGAPPLLDLPTDFPRPAKQGFAGGSVDFAITGDRARALRDLAAANDATPFMLLLAAYAALLGRYADAPEVVISTPVTARPHEDLDMLAGMFVNTIALRLPTGDPSGFRALLAACRAKILKGFEHQDAPFERIVDELDPDRSWAHNPIFQTMFSWKTRDAGVPDLPAGLGWDTLILPSTASKLDLTFGVLDLGDAFELRLEYRADLFRHETAAHMGRAFEALLESLLATPDLATAQLSALHPEQAAQIARWNATGAVDATGTLHGLAASRSDGIALRDAARALTHAELDDRSDTLAAHLQGLGIGRGDRVGIALPRNVDLVVALMAVLKTGAAYVPLDPRYPAERIAYIAADAQLSLILSAEPGEGMLDLTGFWNRPSARPAPVAVQSDDPAYLIYTSGSTGNPKGVVIAHRNAAALIDWARDAFTADEMGGMLGSTSICFDLSVFEIFATLAMGGTLYLVDDLFGLADAPFAAQVTLVNTVPTPMTELLRLGGLPASVRTVCLAGEPLPPSLAQQIHALPGGLRIWNLYGPSEDTTYSTGMVLPRGGAFNIGTPIAGTQAHVLDAHLNPVPPGMPGELFLSGAGVGRGYWNRPDLTAERFLSNPFDTGGAPMMYRTGDRVRWRADGTLDYLGRGDRQMKLRGFRIEPGEIEEALKQIPGVAGAAVDIWHDGDHGRLTAWVEGTATGLGAELSRRLPAHLVPTLFVPVAELPRLPNGKLDRSALPRPAVPDNAAEPVAPKPGLETDLAAIWARVLGHEGIGREDNFFAIGGDSILAIQVVAQAREAGINLSPRDLFQYGNLAALAGAASERGGLARAQGPQTGRQSLTAIQRRFLNRDLPQAAHWNQALVLRPTRRLDADLLRQALAMLADWHDALRARFVRGDGWEQHYAAPGITPNLTITTGDVTEAAAAMQAGFALDGVLWGAVLADGADQCLAVAAHHLIVDGVSWRILLGDLQAIYQALERGETPPQPRRSTSPGAWADFLSTRPATAALAATPLPLDHNGPNREGDAARHDQRFDAALTRQVVQEVPAAYPVTTPELLTAALALALRDWTGRDDMVIDLESHGRPDLSAEIDLSRTVGWLTAIYPLRLETAPDAETTLRRIKDALRAVPDDGVGAPDHSAQIRFNYLGHVPLPADTLFLPADNSTGPARGAENPRDVVLEINAIAHADGLRIGWTHSTAQLDPATVARLADGFARHLDALIRHCLTGDDAGFTPADFPDMEFAQDDLDDLLRSL